MADISYKPIIDEMVWSYSRVKAFDLCPYFTSRIIDIERKGDRYE